MSVWENEWMLAMVTHNIEETTVHLMIKMLIHIACIFPNANKKVTTRKTRIKPPIMARWSLLILLYPV